MFQWSISENRLNPLSPFPQHSLLKPGRVCSGASLISLRSVRDILTSPAERQPAPRHAHATLSATCCRTNQTQETPPGVSTATKGAELPIKATLKTFGHHF